MCMHMCVHASVGWGPPEMSFTITLNYIHNYCMRQDPSLNLEIRESARLVRLTNSWDMLFTACPSHIYPTVHTPFAVPSCHVVGSGGLNSGFHACISGSHPTHSDTSTLKLGNFFQAKPPVSLNFILKLAFMSFGRDPCDGGLVGVGPCSRSTQ